MSTTPNAPKCLKTQQYVNGRKPKSSTKSLIPTVTVRRSVSVVNRTAVDLMPGSGDRFVMVIRRGTKLLLKPIQETGLVNVAPLRIVDHGRAFIALCVEHKGPTLRLHAEWNAAEGAVEIDLSGQPLRSRSRVIAAAVKHFQSLPEAEQEAVFRAGGSNAV